MHKRLIRWFLFSAALLLLATGSAKLISAAGNAGILRAWDPIFSIQFRYLFGILGAVELGVAFFCLFSKQSGLRALLMAWLATSFVGYRLGLIWIGYHRPCNCLGNLTDALHISPQTADTGMKIVLGYLLIGSYATLFWLLKQNRQANSGKSSLISENKSNQACSFSSDKPER